ncbi:MAG: hydratase [Xanthobacteraceae bacterium]|nr:hydratase [Xanthobacteraceae bacterium]
MLIDTASLSDELIAAYDSTKTLPPISVRVPGFAVADGYDVLAAIEERRRRQGWQEVGRKIGFTNRTIWARYGVWEPIWAHMWAHTVHVALDGKARLNLAQFVQPRIEPEVVFRLKTPVPPTDDPSLALACVDWIAPGFEIVQSHFPDWKFAAPDCVAAFGLHGALIVGSPVPVTDQNRDRMAALLPTFELTLRRGDAVVDTGVGANVLDGPPAALAHLARVVAGQPQFAPLTAGEIVTTGTITDAWTVAFGETWSSDYGALGLSGLTLTFV